MLSPPVAKIWSYALFAIRPCRFQLWRAYYFYISVLSLEHNIHSVLTSKSRRLRTVVKISSSLSINFAFAFGTSQYERKVVLLGLIRTLNDAKSNMRARITLLPLQALRGRAPIHSTQFLTSSTELDWLPFDIVVLNQFPNPQPHAVYNSGRTVLFTPGTNAPPLNEAFSRVTN